MKKKLLAILFAIFIFVAIFPIPSSGNNGLYNNISGIIWCTDRPSCIHEIGHKLDQESHWISHTHAFALSLEVFVWKEIEDNDSPHEFVYKIMTHRGLFEWDGFINFHDPQAELYAQMLEWSDGKQENMPEIFWKFYDWKRAEELMEQIARKYGED